MKLSEITLPTLISSAVSGITDNALKHRYEHNYDYSVQEAFLSTVNNLLDISFLVHSTYDNGSSIYTGITNPVPGKYQIYMRFEGVNAIPGVKDFLQKSIQEKTQIISQIMDTCDVYLYSDDPSFYYQGMWEDLDKQGIALFKFTGPSGKGVWTQRHVASGGLSNPEIRVTKHIAQLMREYKNYAQQIAAIITQKHLFERTYKMNRMTKFEEVTIDAFLKQYGINPSDDLSPEASKAFAKACLLAKGNTYKSSNPDIMGLGLDDKYKNEIESAFIGNEALLTKLINHGSLIWNELKTESVAVQSGTRTTTPTLLNVIANAGVVTKADFVALKDIFSQIYDTISNGNNRDRLGKGEILLALILGANVISGADLEYDGNKIEVKADGGRLDGSKIKANLVSLEEYDNFMSTILDHTGIPAEKFISVAQTNKDVLQILSPKKDLKSMALGPTSMRGTSGVGFMGGRGIGSQVKTYKDLFTTDNHKHTVSTIAPVKENIKNIRFLDGLLSSLSPQYHFIEDYFLTMINLRWKCFGEASTSEGTRIINPVNANGTSSGILAKKFARAVRAGNDKAALACLLASDLTFYVDRVEDKPDYFLLTKKLSNDFLIYLAPVKSTEDQIGTDSSTGSLGDMIEKDHASLSDIDGYNQASNYGMNLKK